MSIEEVEETFEDPVSKFVTSGSLEPCKSKFFSGDIISFMDELRTGRFRIYFTQYKYIHDYQNCPNFILDNLNRGFVQQLDDKRKYLFAGFKCVKNNDTYHIFGIWICNCMVPMENVVSDKYDDFEWEELDVNIPAHVEKLLRTLSREPSTNVISLKYLH